MTSSSSSSIRYLACLPNAIQDPTNLVMLSSDSLDILKALCFERIGRLLAQAVKGEESPNTKKRKMSVEEFHALCDQLYDVQGTEFVQKTEMGKVAPKLFRLDLTNPHAQPVAIDDKGNILVAEFKADSEVRPLKPTSKKTSRGRPPKAPLQEKAA
jgi:hypothetical protein